MALWKADLTGEIQDIKDAVNEVAKETLHPLVKDVIGEASDRLDKIVVEASHSLNQVVKNAGLQLNSSIDRLSKEVHDHRSMTKDDVKELIGFAANQFGQMLDQRITALRDETSNLINEKPKCYSKN